MERVLDDTYVTDNEEALMKMCSREQKKGEILEDFIDDLIRLIGQVYLGNHAHGVAMAKDRIEFSARNAYV